MKLSALRLISLMFSLVIDSTLTDRLRLLSISPTSSGLGERFVDETGGEDDDWTSESFSLSFELLFVNNVIERLMKLRPDDDDVSVLVLPVLSVHPFVVEFEANVCRSHGKS